ncbi:MAG: hypothetical protein JKY81_02870 [Colwellia sp.]|nr:hypothetical protein [Colwellia sp.]
MSFFNEIFRFFSGKTEKKQTLHKSDIKFSALIKSIQHNIIEANQSLECVGIKYIEQFFDKEPEPNRVKVINHKFQAIEKVLDAGDARTANKLLLDLKADVNALNSSGAGKATNYRPKMTSFEIPVLKNGVWTAKVMTIPLLALSPVSMPKIKELTFTSTLQNIQHEGDDVYVRLLQDGHAANNSKKKSKKKKVKSENVTEIKILISPEQSKAELNDVITHYEQLLRSN